MTQPPAPTALAPQIPAQRRQPAPGSIVVAEHPGDVQLLDIWATGPYDFAARMDLTPGAGAVLAGLRWAALTSPTSRRKLMLLLNPVINQREAGRLILELLADADLQAGFRTDLHPELLDRYAAAFADTEPPELCSAAGCDRFAERCANHQSRPRTGTQRADEVQHRVDVAGITPAEASASIAEDDAAHGVGATW